MEYQFKLPQTYIINADTSELIEEVISDLQCRSGKYLASLIWDEYQESVKKNAVG